MKGFSIRWFFGVFFDTQTRMYILSTFKTKTPIYTILAIGIFTFTHTFCSTSTTSIPTEETFAPHVHKTESLEGTTHEPTEGIQHTLTDLSKFDPSINIDMRYAGSDNFVGTIIDGYRDNICYLTRKTAEALSKVQASIKKDKLGIKVLDCYRPQSAVDHFKRWATNTKHAQNKSKYHPNILRKNLVSGQYISMHRSGHSRGNTVDLTLIRLGEDEYPVERFTNCIHSQEAKEVGQLNMGTLFDCFDPLSATLHRGPRISEEAQKNRRYLKKVMEAQDFKNYSKEWWHYTYQLDRPKSYLNEPVE